MKKFLGVSFIILVFVFAFVMSAGRPADIPKEAEKETGTTIFFIFILFTGFYLLISHRQDEILEEMKKLTRPKKEDE